MRISRRPVRVALVAGITVLAVTVGKGTMSGAGASRWQGAAPKPVQRPSPDAPLRAAGDALTTMVAREQAFAAAAGRIGIKAAFLEFLDDSAIALEPSPGSAKAVWRGRPDPADPLKMRLAWEPRVGEVSRAGDLGWLSGPYSIVPDGNAAHTGYGCYFSLWRRQPGGLWLVVLDQGIQTPEPCGFPGTGFSGIAPATAGTADPASGKAHIVAVDGTIRNGAALAARLDDAVRIYRPGLQPFVGRAAAKDALGKLSDQTFTPIAAEISASDDLAYTYGKVQSARAGYYVRVWRRAPGADWRVIVDVQTDLQPAR